MTEALAFDDLVPVLHHQLAALPDDRRGQKTPDAIKEAAWGAFAPFLTQAPAFLASQRTMPPANGRSHADRLCGLTDMPCDHQLRTLLDPVAPARLLPVCKGVYVALEGAGHVSAWCSFAGQRLMALDGTEDSASPEMHGAPCSQRTHAHGRVTSVHQAITPVMVAPGTPGRHHLGASVHPHGSQQRGGRGAGPGGPAHLFSRPAGVDPRPPV